MDDDESLGSMIFGPKMGTWQVHSDSDPRWNKSGRSEGLCCSGGPQEMQDWIKKCRLEFGPPPNDAQMMFMKD